MSSLLRTLPPYNDRNGGGGGGGAQPSVHSPSHNNGKVSSPLSTQKNTRKGYSAAWKKWLVRCLIFFSVGFLLGMAPFGEVEVLGARDLSFEETILPRKLENVVDDDFVVDKVELGAVDVKYVKERFDFVLRKQLIVVTPAYSGGAQGGCLDRLGQALRLVPPPLLWIVVEMNVASLETADMLRNSGVVYRHLVCKKNLTDGRGADVHLMNKALEHIEHHKLDGIVYFADADGVHSIELFESIRGISRFGAWPVGMLSENSNKVALEGPVCNGSQVIGWHANGKSGRRRFHIDMSGFAFNSTFLWDPKRWQHLISDPIRVLDSAIKDLMESTFVEQVVEDESQMEGIPPGCSKIMNWHSDSGARELLNLKPLLLQNILDLAPPTS